MACSSSGGVITDVAPGSPSAETTGAVMGMDLAWREYTPPPGADQRGVVVRPRRSRQHEQAAAFFQRGRRVRSRVQEDVPVVEGCHEPDVV